MIATLYQNLQGCFSCGLISENDDDLNSPVFIPNPPVQAEIQECLNKLIATKIITPETCIGN